MGTKRVAKKQSQFMRFMKGPIRILARSLTGCGQNISYGNAMGCPTPQMPSLPRSFSQNASHQKFKTAEEELKDLIRLASTAKVEAVELRRTKSSVPLGGGGAVVAFGRIDEEKPFKFGEGDKVGLLGESYPRSRSYAVLSRRTKME